MNSPPQQFFIFNPQTRELVCQGDWTLANLTHIKHQLDAIKWPKSGTVEVNAEKISRLDSAGAWLLRCYLPKQGLTLNLTHLSKQHELLVEMVMKRADSIKSIPEPRVLNWLARIGKETIIQLQEFQMYLSFIGQLTLESFRILSQPSRIRFNAIAAVIETTGYQALPIIALLSFMIGVVISYQMGDQLRTYGANVFIVDLLGLSVLREFGPLLTAIMVAGRTGSAFTAQIGIMKINQEIDALDTIGVTPAELLLLPRIFGLLIALPLLTMWADVFGVIGGMTMASTMLDVSWHDFLQRFQHEIPLRTLFIGLGKAPVFALIIGTVGCYEGMRVSGSADSVGKQTTRSVVLSIFFIIIVDAIFSVIFSKFNL